ncbi:MAG: glycerol-3-phosphate acyltransferase [bacterium]|nr:glycerol-3-phosphate acyltransferase [bacterium]
MTLILVFMAALGYLIGCIPTAWIALRMSTGQNVTDEGTGNVGAMNVYEVSGKRTLGILVFVGDALKGMAAVLVARAMHDDWFAATAFCVVGCLLGHNYNLFLRGRGGRGLATATGAFAVLNPAVVVIWCVMYLTGYYVIRRNVHVGAVAGTIGVAVLFASTPESILRDSTLQPLYQPGQMRMLLLACSIVIFARHIRPMQALFRQLREEEASESNSE